MFDPDFKDRPKTKKETPGSAITLMTPEQVLEKYLEECEKTRRRHGITKRDGKYWIIDLAEIEALDDDRKGYLRRWIAKVKAQGLYGGVIKEDS